MKRSWSAVPRFLVVMPLPYYEIATFLLVRITFASASTIPTDTNTQQLRFSNLSLSPAQIVALSNSSTTSLSPAPALDVTVPTIAAASNNIDVTCGYGAVLTYDSCVDAFNTFRETRTTNLTIGKRPPAGPDTMQHTQYDLQLPIRWISGTTAPDWSNSAMF